MHPVHATLRPSSSQASLGRCAYRRASASRASVVSGVLSCASCPAGWSVSDILPTVEMLPVAAGGVPLVDRIGWVTLSTRTTRSESPSLQPPGHKPLCRGLRPKNLTPVPRPPPPSPPRVPSRNPRRPARRQRRRREVGARRQEASTSELVTPPTGLPFRLLVCRRSLNEVGASLKNWRQNGWGETPPRPFHPRVRAPALPRRTHIRQRKAHRRHRHNRRYRQHGRSAPLLRVGSRWPQRFPSLQQHPRPALPAKLRLSAPCVRLRRSVSMDPRKRARSS
mmetsp:Transcript_100365/g.287180  ORF Transcript_100365/g.287180 Transcript_100365/m.287180 type:complete len:280 (+) Transcript_100365:4247-5086(+)